MCSLGAIAYFSLTDQFSSASMFYIKNKLRFWLLYSLCHSIIMCTSRLTIAFVYLCRCGSFLNFLAASNQVFSVKVHRTCYRLQGNFIFSFTVLFNTHTPAFPTHNTGPGALSLWGPRLASALPGAPQGPAISPCKKRHLSGLRR